MQNTATTNQTLDGKKNTHPHILSEPEGKL